MVAQWLGLVSWLKSTLGRFTVRSVREVARIGLPKHLNLPKKKLYAESIHTFKLFTIGVLKYTSLAVKLILDKRKNN